MGCNAISVLKSAAAWLGLARQRPTSSDDADGNDGHNEMNPFFTESLPLDIADLAKSYSERSVALFLLDPKMIERQNLAMAKSVHAFFRTTETFRDAQVDSIAKHIAEFRKIYLKSPITMNFYGANFPSGVNLFLIARHLAPRVIVESGVYKGQSSYFLASACPKAEIHAFDPNLGELRHRAPGVKYHDHDWMSMEVACDPVGEGFCFFDDHVNQAKRVIQAHARGFRHMLVDDSWPIEAVIGCGWPPLPSIDMVMSDTLAPGEAVRWVEMGKMWTYVHSEKMRELCARARSLIRAAYEVPSLYRECGIAPTSAYKFIELA